MTTTLYARALTSLLAEGVGAAGAVPERVAEQTTSALASVLAVVQGTFVLATEPRNLLAGGLIGLALALLTADGAGGRPARSVRRAAGRSPSGSARGGWRVAACAGPTTRGSRPS